MILPIEGAKEHNVCFLNFNHNQYEIATFRTDVENINHRHSITKPASSIIEDLKRRDFTINAMAYRPKTNELIDLFSGKYDIDNKIIRAVGNPEDRINEDALRILRAYRFSSRLGFNIDAELKDVCERKFNDVHFYCSKERIREEISKTIYNKILNYESALKVLSTIVDVNDKEKFYKKFDIINNSFDLYTGQSLETQYAIILYEEKDPQKILKSLNFDSRFINNTTKLIRDVNINFNNKIDIKRYLSKEPLDQFYMLLDLQDSLNNNHDKHLQLLKTTVDFLTQKEPYLLKHLKINGNDLKANGYEGKEIGDELNFLLDLVIKVPEYNDKETLLKFSNRTISPDRIPGGDLFQ